MQSLPIGYLSHTHSIEPGPDQMFEDFSILWIKTVLYLLDL